MKNKKQYNVFGWLSVSALLLTAACSENNDLYMSQTSNVKTHTVTINVRPQVQSLGTRGTDSWTISDGKTVNTLIYDIYEQQGENWVSVAYLLEEGATGPLKIENVGWSNEKDYKEIQLIIDGSKKYKMAFWAQYEGTNAYETNDLQKVKVNYTKPESADGEPNYPNNDETRDAFCTSITIDGTKSIYEAIMKRPFAQINVGTAGWDYEGAAVLRPSKMSYTTSKIVLNGLAEYYNVLEGKAYNSEENKETGVSATFEYNKLPAFIHVEDDELDDLTYKHEEEEEHLKVKLSSNKNATNYTYKPYVSWETYEESPETYWNGIMGENNEPVTEDFKYLSMCYVLVPEATETQGSDEKTAATLSSVKFYIYGKELVDDDTQSGENAARRREVETKDSPLFTVKHVPVAKNWRTNILGSSFFVQNQQFLLYVVPDYCGDFNNVGGGENDWRNVTFGPSEDGDWKFKGGTQGTPNENPNFPDDDNYYPKNASGNGGE